jgi:hypothetical protein
MGGYSVQFPTGDFTEGDLPQIRRRGAQLYDPLLNAGFDPNNLAIDESGGPYGPNPLTSPPRLRIDPDAAGSSGGPSLLRPGEEAAATPSRSFQVARPDDAPSLLRPGEIAGPEAPRSPFDVDQGRLHELQGRQRVLDQPMTFKQRLLRAALAAAPIAIAGGIGGAPAAAGAAEGVNAVLQQRQGIQLGEKRTLNQEIENELNREAQERERGGTLAEQVRYHNMMGAMDQARTRLYQSEADRSHDPLTAEAQWYASFKEQNRRNPTPQEIEDHQQNVQRQPAPPHGEYEDWKASLGRTPTTGEIERFHRQPRQDPNAKPPSRTAVATTERDKAREYQKLEQGHQWDPKANLFVNKANPLDSLTQQEWDARKQGIEDEYTNRRNALGLEEEPYQYGATGQRLADQINAPAASKGNAIPPNPWRRGGGQK